jgi:hypothetical protein
MRQVSVHWDDENRRHILVERAERGITRAEVEEVLLAGNTVRWFAKTGRFFAQGRTAAGHCLRVVYVGILQMRPVTAWRVPGRECERWET